MMLSAERLLRLYPRAWRDRYAEEFLATVGDGDLHLQQAIDIVSGAIDAWLSADVRRATSALRVAPGGGGPMTLKSLIACDRAHSRFTARDSLIGSGVMVGATLLFSVLGVATRRNGWTVTGEVLTDIAFLGSLTLSLPFWLMKGQPWKAHVVIIGVTLVLLSVISYLSTVS